MIGVMVGFVACLAYTGECFPLVVHMNPQTYYGYDYDAPPLNIRRWCEHSANFYLRDQSKITKGNVPDILLPSLTGLALEIEFLPDTITCWPLGEEGPR